MVGTLVPLNPKLYSRASVVTVDMFRVALYLQFVSCCTYKQTDREIDMSTYSTRDEAIEREIIAPIEASGVVADARAEYDVDAIADAVLGDYDDGYACIVDDDDFWAVVAGAEKLDRFTTTADEVYRIALDTVDDDRIMDAELVPDDCGSLTLVNVTFSDGTSMVIGPEDEGGYTYSLYAANQYYAQPMMERYLSTDGDTTIDSLADTIRLCARPVLNL